MANVERYNKNYLVNRAIEFINATNIEIEEMNARDFAKFAKISTQPIFRQYKSMDEFKGDIRNILKEQYLNYLKAKVDQNDFLFSLFFNFIKYAKTNPNSYKIIFYSSYASSRTINEILNSKPNQESISKIINKYSIDKEKCEELYRDLRFYCHGIANQIIYQKAIVSEKEIKALLENMIKKLLN